MQKLLIILLFIFSNSVLALENYKCEVTSAFQVDNNGKRYEKILAPWVGSEFTVDRSSGIMTGSLKNSYVTSPEILDFGSSENAFKVITVMKNELISNVYVLVIEEYTEGIRKPFVFTANSDIYHGICNHF